MTRKHTQKRRRRAVSKKTCRRNNPRLEMRRGEEQRRDECMCACVCARAADEKNTRIPMSTHTHTHAEAYIQSRESCNRNRERNQRAKETHTQKRRICQSTTRTLKCGAARRARRQKKKELGRRPKEKTRKQTTDTHECAEAVAERWHTIKHDKTPIRRGRGGGGGASPSTNRKGRRCSEAISVEAPREK